MNTFLILHGWGSCAKNWQRVKEGLERGGCKVYLPDLPGFGENPPFSRPWSIDDYVGWVNDFVKKNNFGQFFLLGHSFGGAISLKYSLQFPEDIKKLILIDPALLRVRREIVEKLTKIFKIFSFLPFYSSMRKVFYEFIIKSDYPNTLGAKRETYLKATREDLSNRLTEVSVSTLLIWGEKDRITPKKDAYLIKEKIADSKLEILPGIGHNPHTESPELLVEKILENI